LRSASDETLADQLSQILTENYDKSRLVTVCRLMKERATFVEDIWTEGSFLLEKPTEYDEKTTRKKWKGNASSIMEEWKTTMASLDDFSPESLETSFKDFITSKELGIGAVLPLFRLLVTGKGMGPSMFEIASFLGKDECVERITEGISALAETTPQA
jgi:glutamyl-tRNA synthetase